MICGNCGTENRAEAKFCDGCGATLARNGDPLPPEERIWGTAATVAASILQGAQIVRAHDVEEMTQVVRVTDCLLHPERRPKNSAG